MRLSKIKPLLEGTLIIFLFLLFDQFFGDADRFMQINPHPFWIPIVLVAALYGSIYAILLSLIATIALYSGNLPSQVFSETLFDYEVKLALRPMMWLIASYIIGAIRDSCDKTILRLSSECAKKDILLRELSEHTLFEREAKEKAEKCIAAQRQTLTTTYEAFKNLKTLNPVVVLKNIDKMVISSLNAKKFSVFACGENGLEAATCYGWTVEDKFFRRFTKDTFFYKKVVEEKKLISVITKEDQKIIEKEGLIAAPLMDPETDEVFGILKVEELSFEDLTLSNLMAFESLCAFIGISYANARKFKEAESKRLITDVQNVYSLHALKFVLTILHACFKKEEKNIHELIFEGRNTEPYKKINPLKSQEVIAYLSKKFPEKIYFFGSNHLNVLHALILGVTPADIQADEILKELKEAGITCRYKQ
jgi:polysaccharide biosynthesis protein PelD